MKIKWFGLTMLLSCLLAAGCFSPLEELYTEKANHAYRDAGDGLGALLIQAIQHDENQTVKNLINAGAPLNYLDPDYHWTPLIHALYFDNDDSVTMILACKPDLNIQDAHGRTALMFAAMRGNTDALVEMLSQGADASICDLYGRNAIHYAIVHEESRNAEYLTRNLRFPDSRRIVNELPVQSDSVPGMVK